MGWIGSYIKTTGLTDGSFAMVRQGLTSFLIFAAWLCAAFWRLPAVDQTALGFLEATEDSTMASVLQVLRLSSSCCDLTEILSAPASQALKDWHEREAVLIPGLRVTVTNVSAAALEGVDGTLLERHEESARWQVRLDQGKTAQIQTQNIHVARLSLEEELAADTDVLAKFINISDTFSGVIQAMYKRRCCECGSVPSEPAWCLLCGAIVCMNSKECKGANNEGQCTAHARACGAGQGLFLLPFMASVLSVSAPRCGLWECPYVDQHGELNTHFERPCFLEMRLDTRRWNQLRQTYTMSRIKREIISHNEKTNRYIPAPL